MPVSSEQDRAVATAASLAVKLVQAGAPPQAHSVWLRTTVDESQQSFIYTVMVSKNPKWKGKFDVPTEHNGFKVEHAPWPQAML